MSKEETVEVTLKFPKGLIDFLKSMNYTVEEYMVNRLVDVVQSELEADAFWNPKEVVEKYGLMSIFKEHGISVSSYLDPKQPY